MTLEAEFPRRATSDVCAELMDAPRELRTAELAVQFLYRELDGEIAFCPPRKPVDIRRDVRQARITLRGLRKRAAMGVAMDGAGLDDYSPAAWKGIREANSTIDAVLADLAAEEEKA